eukprot:15477656-Alexandrium_andersonii.AAC.1
MCEGGGRVEFPGAPPERAVRQVLKTANPARREGRGLARGLRRRGCVIRGVLRPPCRPRALPRPRMAGRAPA